MSNPSPSASSNPAGSGANAQPQSGRYRFCAGQPLDPCDGLSGAAQQPELQAEALRSSSCAGVPDSPAQLLAMQNNTPTPRPEKGPRQPSARLQQVLDLIEQLEVDPADDLDLALRLVRRLESYHDSIVEDLRDDDGADHDQIVAWAIDADRLMRCRLLLESVDLD